MAEYVMAPQFGDAGDYSLSSMFSYDSGGGTIDGSPAPGLGIDLTSYSSSTPYSPGVTTEPEGGSGFSLDWTKIITSGLNTAASIIPVVAGTRPVSAVPAGTVAASPPLVSGGAIPGAVSHPSALGSISPVMLIGAGILAYFALKK